jgi:hypothetical protein
MKKNKILVVGNWKMNPDNAEKAKEAVAEHIHMAGGVTIDYETGLSDLHFISGPSGDYHMISFKEIE